jgi:hypothetical protein
MESEIDKKLEELGLSEASMVLQLCTIKYVREEFDKKLLALYILNAIQGIALIYLLFT